MLPMAGLLGSDGRIGCASRSASPPASLLSDSEHIDLIALMGIEPLAHLALHDPCSCRSAALLQGSPCAPHCPGAHPYLPSFGGKGQPLLNLMQNGVSRLLSDHDHRSLFEKAREGFQAGAIGPQHLPDHRVSQDL